MELRILELVCSKICHDLVSPVGAVNNGVELIQDIGGSVGDDAMLLIASSAKTASARLRLFRMAFGRAGSEAGLGQKDCADTAQGWFQGSKITLDWAAGIVPEAFLDKRGGLKITLLCCLLSEEVLPYGGTVSIKASGNGVEVQAKGRAATLQPELEDALAGKLGIDALTPKNISAHVAGAFCREYGVVLTPRQAGDDTVIFMLK